MAINDFSNKFIQLTERPELLQDKLKKAEAESVARKGALRELCNRSLTGTIQPENKPYANELLNSLSRKPTPDPIEEMKKAGWKYDLNADISNIDPNSEYLIFRRDKPKPNAIVDFERLEQYIKDLNLADLLYIRSLIKRA
jgi:hypothetical protein